MLNAISIMVKAESAGCPAHADPRCHAQLGVMEGSFMRVVRKWMLVSLDLRLESTRAPCQRVHVNPVVRIIAPRRLLRIDATVPVVKNAAFGQRNNLVALADGGIARSWSFKLALRVKGKVAIRNGVGW